MRNAVVVDNTNVDCRDYYGPDTSILMTDFARDAVVATFNAMVEEGGFDVDFPAMWGDGDGRGGKPQPGNIIYLDAYFDVGMDATVIKFDLFEILRDAIELHESGGRVRGEDGIESLDKIRVALLAGAKMIEEACDENNTH